MIINKLELHNFGVFAGTNTLYLNGKKPVVLIGGKNGRGKTTILEAVLLALYGSNSFAYTESKYTTYGQYLKSYVNKVDGTRESYVEIEFSMNDEDNGQYCVKREWDGNGQRTHETITVKRNGEVDPFLTSNWSMFIENLLPSALSSFFFFDGEKISELAVEDTSEQIKESIKAMLGITVLDTLESDLGKIVSKITRQGTNDGVFAELEELRSKKDEAKNALEDIDGRINEVQKRINKTQFELEKLNSDYSIKGGDILEQRNSTLKQRSELIANLVNCQEQLLDIASGELPLLLVQDLIKDILNESEKEHERKLDLLAFDKIKDSYKKFPAHSKEVSAFIKYIQSNIKKDATHSHYDLSDSGLYQIGELDRDLLIQSKGKAKDIIKKRNKYQQKVDEIDNTLSVDVDEKTLKTLFNKIKKKEQQLLDYKVELEILSKERSVLNGDLINAESQFSKLAEKTIGMLESIDSEQRTVKYAQMAINITQAYRIRLQQRKIDVLASTMTTCYKKLANKKNLVDHIEIDSDTLDFHYINAENDEIAKKRLSAGEKQLMVVSLLWALAICSKKKLPVIIDTPLSRLDSAHRKALVKTYFPLASSQTIILSTDSEIDEKYYSLIKNNVGDEYTLKYDDKTRTARIVPGYFGL